MSLAAPQTAPAIRIPRRACISSSAQMEIAGLPFDKRPFCPWWSWMAPGPGRDLVAVKKIDRARGIDPGHRWGSAADLFTTSSTARLIRRCAERRQSGSDVIAGWPISTNAPAPCRVATMRIGA